MTDPNDNFLPTLFLLLPRRRRFCLSIVAVTSSLGLRTLYTSMCRVAARVRVGLARLGLAPGEDREGHPVAPALNDDTTPWQRKVHLSSLDDAKKDSSSELLCCCGLVCLLIRLIKTLALKGAQLLLD